MDFGSEKEIHIVRKITIAFSLQNAMLAEIQLKIPWYAVIF